MVAAITVESNDTFLFFGMDDRERSSREGSTSRAMVLVSKDFAESQRLNAIEVSDGSENRSNAPSRSSEDEDDVIAVSFARRDVQADESSNLEREDIGAVLFECSPLGSDLSFVVYCTDRRRRMISSWRLKPSWHAEVEAGMSP
jgi:hypothetical protein